MGGIVLDPSGLLFAADIIIIESVIALILTIKCGKDCLIIQLSDLNRIVRRFCLNERISLRFVLGCYHLPGKRILFGYGFF